MSTRIGSLKQLGVVRNARVDIAQARGEEGAVFVEFLIAFLPLFIFFLGVVQLGSLFTARLLVEHAATNSARAAAVIIGDDPKRYDREPMHQLVPGGKRLQAIRNAALLTLSPLILNGTVQDVDVSVTSAGTVEATSKIDTVFFSPIGTHSLSKVRVRLQVKAACGLAVVSWLLCPPIDLSHPSWPSQSFLPSRLLQAESIYPYQGARYEY